MLGGDAALGLPGVWFSWASPFDIISAFAKVGIAGKKLAPELIDREEFIDQPAEVAEAASPRIGAKRRRSIDEVAKTPGGDGERLGRGAEGGRSRR